MSENKKKDHNNLLHSNIHIILLIYKKVVISRETKGYE